MTGLQMLGVVLLGTVAVLPGIALGFGFAIWTADRNWHFVPMFVGFMFIELAYCVAATLVLARAGFATL